MNLSSMPQRAPYQPSTELQRRAVEARRNQKRRERYRNIQLYRFAVRAVEVLNRAR